MLDLRSVLIHYARLEDSIQFLNMSDLINQQWYHSLVEDLESTIIECEFTSRWALIEGYHNVGKLLRSVETEFSITELVHRCAVDMEVSERKLWYAVKFFDKFPDLATLPEGKNVSWSSVKRKYLTEPKEKEEEPVLNFESALVKTTLFENFDSLFEAAQATTDGLVIFIPKDLLLKE